MVIVKASRSVALPLLVVIAAFSVFHFSSCGGGGAGGGGGGSAATTTTTTSTTPSAPTITSPSSSPYYSNANSVTISGGCTTGATVSLEGASITTQTFTCASSAYSFTVSKSSDATYSFTVKQTVASVDSATSSLSWIRDTAVSAPTITSPANPYTSADTTFSISGACETGATVSLAGDSTGSTACAGSAYSLSITKSSNAAYNFTVSQTDLAGNTSGNTGFTWTRDTTVPSTPTITSPSLVSGVYYSNGNTLVITISSCTTGLTVTLSGSSITTQTGTCASSAFTFSTITKTSDADYVFSVKQTSAASVDSGAATMTWQRDTSTPSAPTATGPASSPYNSSAATTSIAISGACETNATVNLMGATTESKACTGGAYTFTTYNPGADGTYNFSITQTDRAGNTSGSTSYQWIRDTASPTISTITPATSSGNLSTATNIALSGSGYKSSGMTIMVGGATCSNFSYTSSSNVSCDAPAPHLAQVVNVTVTKANGASVTSTGGFTYTGTATYTLLTQKIFQVYCASCHMGGNASGGLQLDVYSSISARVSAGNAAGSTLYQRVASDSMPQGGPALSTTEKNAIADWINAGANNN